MARRVTSWQHRRPIHLIAADSVVVLLRRFGQLAAACVSRPGGVSMTQDASSGRFPWARRYHGQHRHRSLWHCTCRDHPLIGLSAVGGVAVWLWRFGQLAAACVSHPRGTSMVQGASSGRFRQARRHQGQHRRQSPRWSTRRHHPLITLVAMDSAAVWLGRFGQLAAACVGHPGDVSMAHSASSCSSSGSLRAEHRRPAVQGSAQVRCALVQVAASLLGTG